MILTIIFGVISVVCGGYILIEQYNKKNVAIKHFKSEKERKEILIEYFIARLTFAYNLYEVMILHIEMWANGIKHPNFGPDKFGIFRTKDILQMTPDEVYLGGINGLNTKTLTFWSKCEDDAKNIVLKQYKNLLLSNLKAMKS